MARFSKVSLMLVLGTLGLAAAQPFMEDAALFTQGLTEPAERKDNNYTGFTFNFSTATAGDQTPLSSLVLNQVATNPFLSTLPGDGNGQTLVSLGPCSGNTPHTHPRGSEISYMLYGNIEFGMIEENPNSNNLVLEMVGPNTTIHIPQGVLHFSFNPSCQPAAFLANFATRDPGTQTIWNSMMRVPTHILNSATGIPEQLINGLKQFPQVTAPGTGGEACLAKCGLNFTTSNKLYNLTPEQIVA